MTLNNQTAPVQERSKPTSSPILTPTPTLIPIPDKKTLDNTYHIFQSFNNCGPAALSMALSYYGIQVSQYELGSALRPYQVTNGDNDDKSVTLNEIAEKAKEFGLTPILRPMGDEEVIRQLIANDMPVITRTWTKPDEDIGHFRIIKGYDNERKIFIQDDSLQGKNLEYSYNDFEQLWKKFNYEYLVLVPSDKLELAKSIIGENIDEKLAWSNAVKNSENELHNDPEDIYARFNLSVAYYKIGDFKNSIMEFEKIESALSFRTLWYQIDPIKAYFETGNYNKVFQITDRILNNQNRAFSELYILRGKSYQNLGQPELAREEFRKAVYYNESLKEAQELLSVMQ